MDETISIEAGLGFAVKLKKEEDFIGKKGIIDRGTPTKTRIGIKITGRGIAREACPVYYGDKEIGRTSRGPILLFGLSHAMAPIDMDGLDDNINNIATKLEVDVRGRRINAEIVALPFYKR